VNRRPEELQGEMNELKAENLALKSRLEEGETLKENVTQEKLSLEEQVKEHERKMADAVKEISELKLNLEVEVKLRRKYSNECRNLKACESSLKEELEILI
jgi:chromosome segregation ATPase